ncbi:hypothetical protein KCP78_05610 [Salmonella enterica subsp. enterica]|nr:hypothetical protein KCP78_05610 [Salmonella enterica subsp. enterica]
MVFNSATYGTGLTADTTPQVDKHGVTVSGGLHAAPAKIRFSQRNQRRRQRWDAELLENTCRLLLYPILTPVHIANNETFVTMLVHV